MKIEKVKEIIQSQKNSLPLSYSELVFRENGKEKAKLKITLSDYYKDDNYVLFPLFKKISRLI